MKFFFCIQKFEFYTYINKTNKLFSFKLIINDFRQLSTGSEINEMEKNDRVIISRFQINIHLATGTSKGDIVLNRNLTGKPQVTSKDKTIF